MTHLYQMCTSPNVGGQSLHITGLSWYCDQRMVRCNYSGHHAGFHDFVFWDRERNESVAFVTNSSLPAWQIASLQRDLVNALAGRAFDSDSAAVFLDIVDIDPTEIAGRYTAADLPDLTLTITPGGGIKIRMSNGLEYDAFPAARQVLYVPGSDFYLAFSSDTTTRTMHVKAQELNVVMRRL